MRLAALALTAGLAAAPVMAEVNIYAFNQPYLAPLAKAFEEKTGTQVNVVNLSGGLVERLQAEGARSPADLATSVDIAVLKEVVDAGLTQPVDSEVLESRIPPLLRDEGNHWFATTMRGRVVFASKERVEPGAIETYADLTDPRWKGRICIRPGLHPYNVTLFGAMIAHTGKEATRDWLNGLRANLARKPQGNDRAQIKAIAAGQCDIAVGNTYYLGQMHARDETRDIAEQVRVVFPAFAEGGGTHINISGVAMTKAAPHPGDAKAFMEFLVTKEAQEIFARINFEYPVVAGASPAPFVQEWGEFTPDDLPLETLAEMRDEAVRLVEEVGFDG